MEIYNFDDFCRALLSAGFSMGGGDPKGIYAAIPWSWKEEPPYPTPVRWHTGDLDKDPWEWRMRVLEERNDIAYGKLFFGVSGYITREWYGYFYKLRRGGRTLDDEYADGTVSEDHLRVFDVIEENGFIPLHMLKEYSGFSGSGSQRFDRILRDLQMKMYVTICGRTRKLTADGKMYGWNTTILTTVENFWENGVPECGCSAEEVEARITERIKFLNPSADNKKIHKFIYG